MSRPEEVEHHNPTHFAGDLRRALLDATAQAITEVGPAGVSLRDVARRVGVSHAAPAHHFGDKAGLLTALATEGFELLINEIQSVMEVEPARDSPAGDTPAALDAAGRPGLGELRRALMAPAVAYVRFATTHRGHFEIMWRSEMLRADDPAYVRASLGAFGALVDAVAAMKARGWAPGREPMELALASWALVHGVASLHNAGVLEWITAGQPPEDLAGNLAMLMAESLDVRPDGGFGLGTGR